MITCPMLLEDNTLLRDAYEVTQYLYKCGFSPDQVDDLIGQREEEYMYEISGLQNKSDEYELIADDYSQRLSGLVNEIEEVVKRLRSGRSGRGYTKEDLAGTLSNAIRIWSL